MLICGRFSSALITSLYLIRNHSEHHRYVWCLYCWRYRVSSVRELGSWRSVQKYSIWTDSNVRDCSLGLHRSSLHYTHFIELYRGIEETAQAMWGKSIQSSSVVLSLRWILCCRMRGYILRQLLFQCNERRGSSCRRRIQWVP